MKPFLIFLITWLLSLSGINREYEIINISGDIELIKISENAYIHVTYSELPEFGRFSSNGLLYIDNGKGYLFDTPMTDSMTKELVDWIVDSLDVEILFAGCMVKEYGARGLGNTADGDLREYPVTIDKVTARFPTAKIVIPGHGQVGGMELLRHTKELSTNLCNTTDILL